MKIKSIKRNQQGHTSNEKFGVGDNYGSGVTNKVGRSIDSSMHYSAETPSKLKTPPKKLA